jgi:hypothetical protein
LADRPPLRSGFLTTENPITISLFNFLISIQENSGKFMVLILLDVPLAGGRPSRRGNVVAAPCVSRVGLAGAPEGRKPGVQLAKEILTSYWKSGITGHRPDPATTYFIGRQNLPI